MVSQLAHRHGIAAPAFKNIVDTNVYRDRKTFNLNRNLKVHKIENYFGSDIEFCVISLLFMLKKLRFCKKHFLIRPLLGEIQLSRVV